MTMNNVGYCDNEQGGFPEMLWHVAYMSEMSSCRHQAVRLLMIEFSHGHPHGGWVAMCLNGF